MIAKTKQFFKPPTKLQFSKVVTNWQLYVMMILPLLLLFVFSYVPMYGVQMAFRDFKISLGISGSPWVGLKYFKQFFLDYQAIRIIKNTIGISVYSMLASFPLAIIFAICLNYLRSDKYRKVVQTVSYLPHLISTVVVVIMILQFLAPRRGFVTILLNRIFVTQIDFLSVPAYFDDIYVWSGIWQSTGFNSIIYIATIIGIDPEMHEAAIVDGASKWKRILYIDLPCLMPTAIKLLILNTGQILNVGYEKVLLMQNPLNLSKSEVISTYVYKIGLTSMVPQYSYSTAIGLFQSIVGMVLIVIVNRIANRLDDNGIW